MYVWIKIIIIHSKYYYYNIYNCDSIIGTIKLLFVVMNGMHIDL